MFQTRNQRLDLQPIVKVTEHNMSAYVNYTNLVSFSTAFVSERK